MADDTRPAIIDWLRQHIENYGTGMLYRDAAIEQIKFFSTQIAGLFAPPDQRGAEYRFCKIDGWHTSKSISLPVYYLNNGVVEIVARDNFYNWNVTVVSSRNIDLPAYFDVNSGDGYLFMEGMENWRREPYQTNRKEFTFCTWNKYVLFAILMCVAAQTKPTTPPASPVASPLPERSGSA